MLRHIKPGDVFAFLLGTNRYGFGRIISIVTLGHVAEFFDHVHDHPVVDSKELGQMKRLGKPVVLDSYSLFDRKVDVDWRIIGYQDDFVPEAIVNVFFVYGDGTGCRKVDVFGKESPVSAGEAQGLPFYAPLGDMDVKREIYDLPE